MEKGKKLLKGFWWTFRNLGTLVQINWRGLEEEFGKKGRGLEFGHWFGWPGKPLYWLVQLGLGRHLRREGSFWGQEGLGLKGGFNSLIGG